jgi:hypothetical protein
MSKPTGKVLAAFVGGFLILALIGYLAFQVFENHLRVSFAEEQISVFDEMRQQSETSSPVGAAECLEYVLNYFPSGTKQLQGSTLDRLVERARAMSEREIIAILRTKTGKDFGDNPQRWIEELRATQLPTAAAKVTK